MSPRVRVELHGDQIFFSTGRWSETFPIGDLDEKIAFYQFLHDRKRGRYQKHYAPKLNALKEMAQQIKE